MQNIFYCWLRWFHGFVRETEVQSPDPASSARPPQVSSASGGQQGGLPHQEASCRFIKWSRWNSSPCKHFCQHQLLHSQQKATWTEKEIRAEGGGEPGLIGEKEQNGYFFPEVPASCDISRGKTSAATALKDSSIFFRRKGSKKWTFARKYCRLPSWWKNSQRRLDTPGRRNWRRWYFWASGGRWLKAGAGRLTGWGIWTHRCRHLTGGPRTGPPMWTGMWETAGGKSRSPHSLRMQRGSQVQTSLRKVTECSVWNVSFTQGLKGTEPAFLLLW